MGVATVFLLMKQTVLIETKQVGLSAATLKLLCHSEHPTNAPTCNLLKVEAECSKNTTKVKTINAV